MAIRTNTILEVDVTGSSGDPVKGDMPGIADAKTSIVPNGAPVEPQIQTPTPLNTKNAEEIASTKGLIPEGIPSDKYDKLATGEINPAKNEGAVKMTLADIIDESKLAAYVYNKLTGKTAVTEAPEPKPAPVVAESAADAPEPKPVAESDKTITEANDDGTAVSKEIEKAMKDTKPDKDFKTENGSVELSEQEMADLAKLEEAIDAEYDKHYRPALEQIADHDTDGKMVYEAVKKIATSKKIAKDKIKEKFLKAKADKKAKDDKESAKAKKVLDKIKEGKKKDVCPKCGKSPCECKGSAKKECGSTGSSMPMKVAGPF